jgi:GntR family transcriptional regulator
MRLDRSSPIPLYFQLKTELLRMLQARELKVGDRLPSEGELMTQFGLSRFPIRQALAALEREGWIVRQRGKRTFISEPKLPLSVAWHLIGFSEDLQRKGHKVETRVFRIAVAKSTSDVARKLEIKSESPVVHIGRLRLVDNCPFLVDYVWVRSDLCPGLEKIDLNNASLFKTYQKSYGLAIRRAHRTLSIARAAPEVARLLELKPRSSVFKLTDLCYIGDGRPIQFAHTLINENRGEFVFDLFDEKDAKSETKIVVKLATPRKARARRRR